MINKVHVLHHCKFTVQGGQKAILGSSQLNLATAYMVHLPSSKSPSEIAHPHSSQTPYAWNVTFHTLTHPSAPALASSPSFSQNTALMPPGPAFLSAMFFIGFPTLQT